MTQSTFFQNQSCQQKFLPKDKCYTKLKIIAYKLKILLKYYQVK